MISYLKGRIKYIGSNWLILDVGDIGYKVFVNPKSETRNPKQTRNSNSKTGNLLELYTYHHIREDRQELYGFETMDGLQTFELLIEVNGVGPKMAMNILSQVDAEKLKNCIALGDTTIFTTISGVGKKIAAKIIVELKNKIGSLTDADINEALDGGGELMDAMESLGYKNSEIFPYINKIPSSCSSTEAKIKWILKEIK